MKQQVCKYGTCINLFFHTFVRSIYVLPLSLGLSNYSQTIQAFVVGLIFPI